MNIKQITFLTTLLALITGFSSCKKMQELKPLPQNLITEYKVINIDSEEPITGVVDNTDNTITVYVPFYYDADVVDAEIKVSSGAKLKETIEPVNVLDQTQTYTVTGANGDTRVYKLKIVLQQMEPLYLSEISTATSNKMLSINGYFSVAGSYYTMDVNKIKVFLTDSKGVRTPASTTTALSVVPGSNPNVAYPTYIFGLLKIPAALEPGLYHVSAKVLGLEATMTYPVNLAFAAPKIVNAAYNITQGETFVIKAPDGTVFNQFKSFKMNVSGTLRALEIVSYTRTEATIKVPADFPVGAYRNAEAEFEGWPVLKTIVSLTVKAK